jgi:hypothetical protein
MSSDYDKRLGSLAKRYDRERKLKKYYQYIVDEMISESEFENSVKVISTPWGIDYDYGMIYYNIALYSFEDYVHTNYGVSKGDESMELFSLFRQAVYDKIGYRD